MVGATLNRTLKSYALAIVGAEYVLGWLPKGTHNWHQFVTPAEFKTHFARAGLKTIGEAGVTYNPLTRRWSLSRDTSVNYMVAARRPGGVGQARGTGRLFAGRPHARAAKPLRGDPRPERWQSGRMHRTRNAA